MIIIESLSRQWDKGHFFEIVALDLLHEMRSYLQFSIQYQLKALLHRNFRYPYEVAHRNNCSQLQVGSMDKHFSPFCEGIPHEAVGQSVKLFDIFFGVAVEVYREILEILMPFCVLLTCDIQHVGDAQLKQRFNLQSRCESSEV